MAARSDYSTYGFVEEGYNSAWFTILYYDKRHIYIKWLICTILEK